MTVDVNGKARVLSIFTKYLEVNHMETGGSTDIVEVHQLLGIVISLRLQATSGDGMIRDIELGDLDRRRDNHHVEDMYLDRKHA